MKKILFSLFFAAVEIFASQLQGIPGVPAAAILALPYIVLVICSSMRQTLKNKI